MGERSRPYAIRDRLQQRHETDTEPDSVALTIGRKIVWQQLYGMSENDRRSHPMYKFADSIESDSRNATIGEAVRGIDLSLEYLNSDQLDRIIRNNRSANRSANTRTKKRKGYIRDAKKDIKATFREQQFDDTTTLDLVEGITDTSSLLHIPRSLTMFENEVEFIDYEQADRQNKAYVERGAGYIGLSRRTKTNFKTGETYVKPLLEGDIGEFNELMILDDLSRINEGLSNAGLLNGKMGKLRLDDLDLGILFFKSNEGAMRARRRPSLPIPVPTELISVQPLAIWEN